MTTLRQSIVAAKYHKKLTVICTFFFAILFFLLTLLSQLTLTQSIALNFILGKWEHIKKILPQVESTLNEQLIDSNLYVTTIYHKLFIYLIISSIVIFFLLSIYSACVRKEEINSMYFIGIRKTKILKHLLTELIVPIFFGFSSVVILILIFHSNFVNESINLNRKFVDKYFDQQTIVFNQNDELSNLTTTKTNKSFQSSSKENKAILPYNKISLFEVKVENPPVKQTIFRYITNLLTISATAIVGSLIGFFSYMMFSSRRRELPK